MANKVYLMIALFASTIGSFIGVLTFRLVLVTNPDWTYNTAGFYIFAGCCSATPVSILAFLAVPRASGSPVRIAALAVGATLIGAVAE